ASKQNARHKGCGEIGLRFPGGLPHGLAYEKSDAQQDEGADGASLVPRLQVDVVAVMPGRDAKIRIRSKRCIIAIEIVVRSRGIDAGAKDRSLAEELGGIAPDDDAVLRTAGQPCRQI